MGKFLLACAVICMVASISVARNVPQGSSQRRTFGNFGPKIPRTFQTFHGVQAQYSEGSSPVTAAINYFARQINASPDSIRVSSSHTSKHNGVSHVYLQQIVNGLEVSNGVGNVNIDKTGKVISFGNSFFNGELPSAVSPHTHSASDALRSLAGLVSINPGHISEVQESVNTVHVIAEGLKHKDVPASLKYIQKDNKLVLAWNVRMETENNMYNAFVDANTNVVASLIDWVSDASYNIFPLGINDPSSGDRQLVVDPAHPVASPDGWHKRGTNTFNDTKGNNVYAQDNPTAGSDYINNYRPVGGEELAFDFPLDLTLEPEEYKDVSITNLFYWNNIIHDLFYVYGFDETSGNFQENNFGRGGEQLDAVIAFAQDGGGTNNANFMTPPDGDRGVMRMYVWSQTDPWRDGDLDGGIVMHEFCHGLSIRLTGGPQNVGCLGFGESGGMGEGWGDLFATVTRTTNATDRTQEYQMGDYSNGGEGIRNYPYSTNFDTNPTTYEYVTRPGYGGVHAKGEVWAVILYEVYWNLVEKHGFDPDWFNVEAKSEGTYKSLIDGKEHQRQPRAQEGPAGNVLFIQLLVDGMKIQPCNPTFVDARDAILQADSQNNAGANACEIWTGFAKRGLGVNAAYEGEEDFDVPQACAPEKK